MFCQLEQVDVLKRRVFFKRKSEMAKGKIKNKTKSNHYGE